MVTILSAVSKVFFGVCLCVIVMCVVVRPAPDGVGDGAS